MKHFNGTPFLKNIQKQQEQQSHKKRGRPKKILHVENLQAKIKENNVTIYDKLMQQQNIQENDAKNNLITQNNGSSFSYKKNDEQEQVNEFDKEYQMEFERNNINPEEFNKFQEECNVFNLETLTGSQSKNQLNSDNFLTQVKVIPTKMSNNFSTEQGIQKPSTQKNQKKVLSKSIESMQNTTVSDSILDNILKNQSLPKNSFERAKLVLQNCKQLNQKLDKVKLKVTDLINSIDTSARNIIQNMQLKYQKLKNQQQNQSIDLWNNGESSIVTQSAHENNKIKGSMHEFDQNLNTMLSSLERYDQCLEQIQLLRKFKFEVNVNIEASFKEIEMDQNIKYYNKIVSQVTENIYALQSFENQTIDLVKFNYNNNRKFSSEVIKTFKLNKHTYSTITQHGDRYICDDIVFPFDSNKPALKFDQEDPVTGAVVLTDQIICLGHQYFMTFTLQKWNGNSYERIYRGQNTKQQSQRYLKTHNLQLNKFRTDILQVVGQFGSNLIYLLNFNAKDLHNPDKVDKVRLYQKQREILDFRIVNERTIVVLNEKDIEIVEIRHPAGQIHTTFQPKVIQPHLILHPQFDSENKQIIIGKNRFDSYEFLDVTNNGIKAKIANSGPKGYTSTPSNSNNNVIQKSVNKQSKAQKMQMQKEGEEMVMDEMLGQIVIKDENNQCEDILMLMNGANNTLKTKLIKLVVE